MHTSNYPSTSPSPSPSSSSLPSIPLLNRPPPPPTTSSHAPTNQQPYHNRLPDASIPAATLASDIAAIASVGAGGLELLGYYQYGLPEAERGVAPPTDWTKYGFGTPAFKDIFVAALNAVADEGLVMDFVQGANQGQGVPSVPEEEGLAVELAYWNASVAGGETWTGVLGESVQPVNYFSSFMHSLEEFGGQVLKAVVGVEVVGGEFFLAGSLLVAIAFLFFFLQTSHTRGSADLGGVYSVRSLRRRGWLCVHLSGEHDWAGD